MLVGTGGLSWTDVSERATPNLWALLRDGSGGAMSIRSVYTNTCPIDGWLKVVSRDANGCMQIYQPTAETSRSIDDWLAQVEIDNSDD